MTEVLCDNFSKLLPEIITSIKQARFIAIDTEFTALYLHDQNKPRYLMPLFHACSSSLFDDGNARYDKIRNTVHHSLPIQIGLSLFEFTTAHNIYQAKTYTFYIWPQPIMSLNCLLKFQASCFQFLSQFDFDYNKLIYNGIPFLNNAQEAQVLKDLQSSRYMPDSSIEHYLDEITPAITKWFTKAKENETFTVASSKARLKWNVDAWYQVQFHLRKSFKPELWTEVSEQRELIVRKVTESTFKQLNENDNLVAQTINDALGFTLVYRALLAAKKPIVGHNMLMDLLLLMSTFGEALPASYKKFKARLREDFPCLVDTKCLSYLTMKAIPRSMEWRKNTLQDLHEYFAAGNGRKLSYNAPLIRTDLALEKNRYHHAGWDSYSTGFVFVRMAHYMATCKLGIRSHKLRDIVCSEHFDAVQPVVNQLNLIRAALSHINVNGADPQSRRPPWLVVRSLRKELDTSQVLAALSDFGYVEIQQISNTTAFIAVPTSNAAMNILKTANDFADFRISKYNFLLHHKLSTFMQCIPVVVMASWLALHLLRNYGR